MEFYHMRGVIRPEGELLSATTTFPNVAQARMAKRMLAENDELGAEWKHVEILRQIEHSRVSLTIVDSESAAWAVKGAHL